MREVLYYNHIFSLSLASPALKSSKFLALSSPAYLIALLLNYSSHLLEVLS